MNPPTMWMRIRRLVRVDARAEIEDEVRHHLEMRARDLTARGMSPDEAWAEAVRRFGDVEAVQREVVSIDGAARRSERRTAWISDSLQDLRHGVRTLGRSPGFTIAAVGILALAIGANTAVFSAVDSVLLKPLPVADPDRLVMLWEENAERGWYRETAAPANVLDWRDRVDAFADVAAYASFPDPVTLVGGGDPMAVTARTVTGNFFSVLGVAPAIGRFPRDEETWSTSEAVMVLGHTTWMRSFGGAASVVGEIARLNGVPYRIIGVAPQGFRLPGVEADLWRTIRWEPADATTTSFRRAHYLRPIARLRPGVTVDEAGAQLATVATALEREYPETNRLMRAGVTPLHEFLVGDVSATLKFLLGAVVLLLLLAAANVGNLLLVRALGRQRELAVRVALGAGRARLVRQIFVESIVISGLGGAFGLLTGLAALRFFGVFGTGRLVDEVQPVLDLRVLGYVLAILVVGGLVFSLAPLALAGRTSVGDVLREGGQRASAGRGARRVSGTLVAGEVAIAVLLLAGAVLLARSFSALQRVAPGFESTGVFTGGLAPPVSSYESGEEIVAFFDEVIREVEALPGVERAAVARQLPATSASWTSDFSVAGRAPDEYGVEVVHREISPGYFDVMRVPLLRGRAFTSEDRGGTDEVGSRRVIVINDALAEQYFPGEDPIGARIAFTRTPTDDSVWWTVVGVVGTELQASPADGARIEIFAPVAQAPTRGMKLVVRTSVPPATLAGPIASIVQRIDPDVLLADPATMEEVREAATARERFMMMIVAAFAAVAVSLALVGVFGVIAQALRARRREMAIRAALGATRFDLLSLSIRQSLPMLAAGITAGVVGTLLASGFAASLVYVVEPRDPAMLAMVASAILAMGIAATLLSSARVGIAQPSAVLRED